MTTVIGLHYFSEKNTQDSGIIHFNDWFFSCYVKFHFLIFILLLSYIFQDTK